MSDHETQLNDDNSHAIVKNSHHSDPLQTHITPLLDSQIVQYHQYVHPYHRQIIPHSTITHLIHLNNHTNIFPVHSYPTVDSDFYLTTPIPSSTPFRIHLHQSPHPP